MESRTMSTRLVLLFAVAAGLSAANLYYAQPVLEDIARSFGITAGNASLLVTCAQIGYAAGLALVVPLGDLLPRRQLIAVMLVATAAALVAAAIAPSMLVLAVATVAAGLGSVAAQIIVPLAASLASEDTRGRVVGAVMSGLLLGILLARTAAGFIAGASSWRAVYWIAAAAVLVLAAALWTAIPAERPRPRLTYGSLLASTVKVMRDEAVLRRRSLLGLFNFAAFSIFWTTLTFHLTAAPFHYGPATIGLFGLIGAAGAIVANVAGRWADRGWHEITTAVFVGCVVLSYLLLWVWGTNLAVLIVAIVVLDIGISGVQITNQSVIFSLAPELRSRINSGYMVLYFTGGALGSALGGVAWTHGAWGGVCALGLGVALVQVGVVAWDACANRRPTTTAEFA